MNEITKTKDQRPKPERITWLILALVTIVVYFFGLNISLLGPDEPRYAQVAREMFLRADWVTPTLGGFDWFEKPALLYWLQIFSYKIFGVSEFAARFGSAIFGLGTIFSLWILGRFLATEHTEKEGEFENKEILLPSSVSSAAKNDFANWLALIAASSIGLLAFSRGASFDIILTFPMTAALVAFFIFDQSNKKSFTTYHLPLFTFYFFIGVALLAKGLVGIVFPFAIVAFYFILSRKLPGKTFIFSLFWGTILSLSVAAIWYVPMYLTNGWKFIDEFFVQHHFARYASNKYQHPQPFWFFFLVLPLMTIPWLPFFAASIWNFFRIQDSGFRIQDSGFRIQDSKLKAQSQENSPRLRVSAFPLRLFAVSWLVVPLVFFSFSGSKLPGYILPALPAALILTAEYVSGFVQKSKRRKIFVQLVAFAMFAVVAVLLQFFVVSQVPTETVKPLIEIAAANGYEREKVVNLNTISHNAEFYAAGRLVRTDDGKQRRFFDAAEIVVEMKREDAKSVLVLVPIQFLSQLTESDLVETKVLSDNTELAIVSVKLK
jgi:4-amino-4-deoxy-L-arabinose transferase-like glycosyltransferase